MFDFKEAEVTKGSAYKEVIKPGISVVKVTSITNGLSSQKQSPYLEITVEEADGSELKQQYYLNTVVGEGKTKCAWDISKNAILSLVAAANNYDEVTAKTKMPNAQNAEELASKLSLLLVGKDFKLKVIGEEKIAQSGKRYVASSFAQGVFCEPKTTNPSKLFFSEEKNIKRLPATTSVVDSTFSSPTNDGVAF